MLPGVDSLLEVVQPTVRQLQVNLKLAGNSVSVGSNPGNVRKQRPSNCAALELTRDSARRPPSLGIGRLGLEGKGKSTDSALKARNPSALDSLQFPGL